VRPVELSNQTAIITGAGRGIGKAIALALASCGARVVLASRTEKELRDVALAITDLGGEAIVAPTDISDEASVAGLFLQVGKRLHILVNNAGVGSFGPLAEFSTQDFDRIMAVNVRGTFLCCREALRLMLPHRSGAIINISSVVGFKGYPNQAAYTASKHAIMGLTKSLAAEVSTQGIRVSAILPGGVDTDMVAQSRPDLDRSVLMSPYDVADAVLYLLSLSPQAAVDQIYIRRRSSAPF
jgi:3-oxoacyl-[acyl-carrier protein] reductase